MPLELTQALIRVKIDRTQLRAEVKAARREIIKGLSGIRVRIDIDARHFQRQAAAAGRAAGRAAGAAAQAGFQESVRRGSATGMVPTGGGMSYRGGGGVYDTSTGTFLMGGHPAGRIAGPAGRTFAMGGPGQRRVGTSFGGRSRRSIGGSTFTPRGLLGGPSPGGGAGGASPWAWSSMYGGMFGGGGGGGRQSRAGGAGRGGRRSGGPGGRGFFGSGPGGRFAGGFAFQMNPLLALSAHYGGPAGAAGAVTAMGATAGLKSYAEFEDSIKWVKILQREAGAAESAMARLENQARQVGRTTVFSATEAANAMATLTKRGFSAAQVQQQLPHVLNLAVAGELDIEEASDIVANAQKQFQLGAEDSREIADLLAKASLDSASDVRTLGVALSYVGPVAKSAGMDLKETLSIITALEDAGLKSSRAGTGLARVIAKLANEDTEEAFRGIGVEVRDANRQFRSTIELVDELQDALRNMPAPDKYAFFNQLFRERGGLALTAVVNQGADAIDRMRQSLEDAGGTSGRIAEERMNSLQKQFEALKNSAKDLGVEFGNLFGPGLTDLLKNTRREIEMIRMTIMSDQDFRAEQQKRVDAINAALIRPRVPEGGQAFPVGVEQEFVAPAHPGNVGPILGRGVGAAGRARLGRGSSVRAGIGTFGPAQSSGRLEDHRRRRAAWLQQFRATQEHWRAGRLEMAEHEIDMLINPGRVRPSGAFGKSGGGIGPATATGLDVAPLEGGRTGTRPLNAEERKARNRENVKWIEDRNLLRHGLWYGAGDERNQFKSRAEAMSAYRSSTAYAEERRKTADNLRSLREDDDFVEDDTPIKPTRSGGDTGRYPPQMMGIQEYLRSVQLGALDKKDKYLEEIADYTKQTADNTKNQKPATAS